MAASKKRFHATIATTARDPRLLEVTLDNAPIGSGGTISGVKIFVYEVDQINKEKLVGEKKFDPKTNKDDLVCVFTLDVTHEAEADGKPESFTLTETDFDTKAPRAGQFVGANISITLAGAKNEIHRAEVLFDELERRNKNRPTWSPPRPANLEFGIDVQANGHPTYSSRKRIDSLQTHYLVKT